MKTLSFLSAATLSLALFAGCSSSSGDSDAGTGGNEAQGGGNTGGSAGTGGEGGSSACGEVPLDCLAGEYVTDANGCTICREWACSEGSCNAGGGTCAGDDLFVCDFGEGCGAFDAAVDPVCAGYVCAAGEWTCECPAMRPPPGTACGDVGQQCTVSSDLDCGPATVDIVCTESGWSDAGLDGAGGGTDCG